MHVNQKKKVRASSVEYRLTLEHCNTNPTHSISMSGGSVQLIVVRARPEQSTHRAPHDTHALPLQDPGVKLVSEPGDSPEPDPDAGENDMTVHNPMRSYID